MIDLYVIVNSPSKTACVLAEMIEQQVIHHMIQDRVTDEAISEALSFAQRGFVQFHTNQDQWLVSVSYLTR